MQLRDVATPPEQFRVLAERISLVLGAEALATLAAATGAGDDAARAG